MCLKNNLKKSKKDLSMINTKTPTNTYKIKKYRKAKQGQKS